MATYTGIRKLSPRQVLLTGGAVVAMGVVVGLGSWRLSGQGHTTHPATAAVNQAQPAITQVQRAPQPAVATTQRSGASLYLVASADEATVMRQAAATLGARLGPRDDFVVANSDDDLAAVAQLVAAENALLAAASLPPITIRDLRPAPRSGSTTSAIAALSSPSGSSWSPVSDQEMYARWKTAQTAASTGGETRALVSDQEMYAQWLQHHAVTINIRGESYRLKDKRKAGVFAASQMEASVTR